MSETFDLPEPDPVKAAQWASLGRHALTYGGGVLSSFGVSMPSWLTGVTDPQITNIVMAGMFFGGLAMSAAGFLKGRWDAWRKRQILVASSVASAEHGIPVAVAVTPAGMPNIATAISVSEQVAAPSVPAGVPPQPAPVAALR